MARKLHFLDFMKKMVNPFFLSSLLLLMSACGDVRLEDYPQTKVEGPDVELKAMIADLDSSGASLSQKYKDLNQALNKKILGTLGKDASEPIQGGASGREYWVNVFLVVNKNDFFLVNVNQQSSMMKLDMTQLSLEVGGKSHKLIRTYSKNDYIEWWFDGGPKEVDQLFLQPNTNTNRLEGHLRRFMEP